MTEHKTKYASWANVAEFVGEAAIFTLRWIAPWIVLIVLAFTYGWPVLVAALLGVWLVKR